MVIDFCTEHLKNTFDGADDTITYFDPNNEEATTTKDQSVGRLADGGVSVSRGSTPAASATNMEVEQDKQNFDFVSHPWSELPVVADCLAPQRKSQSNYSVPVPTTLPSSPVLFPLPNSMRGLSQWKLSPTSTHPESQHARESEGCHGVSSRPYTQHCSSIQCSSAHANFHKENSTTSCSESPDLPHSASSESTSLIPLGSAHGRSSDLSTESNIVESSSGLKANSSLDAGSGVNTNNVHSRVSPEKMCMGGSPIFTSKSTGKQPADWNPPPRGQTVVSKALA